MQADLDGDLAYTTVMTILTRLWKKGLVTRSRYRARLCLCPDPSTGGVPRRKRIRGELRRTRNRSAVLSQFVDKLSKKDTEALRGLLSELDD